MTCGASSIRRCPACVLCKHEWDFYCCFYSSEFFVVAQTFMALMMEETKPPLSSSFIPLIVTPPGVVIRSISMQGWVGWLRRSSVAPSSPYAAMSMASWGEIPSSMPACMAACTYFNAKATPLDVNVVATSSFCSSRNIHFPPSSKIRLMSSFCSSVAPREEINVRLERSEIAILGIALKIGISRFTRRAKCIISMPATTETSICSDENRSEDRTVSTFEAFTAYTIISASAVACLLSVEVCMAGKRWVKRSNLSGL